MEKCDRFPHECPKCDPEGKCEIVKNAKICGALLRGIPLSIVALGESNMEALKEFAKFHALMSRWEENVKTSYALIMKNIHYPNFIRL